MSKIMLAPEVMAPPLRLLTKPRELREFRREDVRTANLAAVDSLEYAPAS